MKVTVNGLDLSTAVGKVIKAASTRTTNPILEGVKIKAEKDVLTLTCTDQELAIEKCIKADIDSDGEVVVPGKFFAEYIRRVEDAQVELILNAGRVLTIKYQDSVSEIRCMNEDEYPPVKNLDNAEGFSITQKDFKDLISKVVFSVATDEARPVLKGCLLEINENTLTAVALDGYRLARCIKPIKNVSAAMDAVVPSRSLSEVHKLLDDSDTPVRVLKQRNFMMVEFSDGRLTTRLLDGDYFNYKQIIPAEFTTEITVNKKQLENGLDRASLLSRADKTSNLVKMDVTENVMTLTAESDIGTSRERVAIKLAGKDIYTAYNVKNFVEALRAIPDEFIKIRFIKAENPCLITATGAESDYTYLILSIRRRDNM